jgi:tetratricopeptide (TPR) repeat protein
LLAKRLNIHLFRWAFLMPVMWLFILHPASANTQLKGKPPYKPDLFVNIKSVAAGNRVDAARKLYRENCREMSEQDADKSLDDLRKIARELNDPSLECAIYDMSADYFSVNRGYNAVSTAYFDKAIAFSEKNNMVLEAAIYQHRKAVYYYLYKQNAAASRYFLLSEENFHRIGFERVPDVSIYFLETANFYYSLGNYDIARYNLRNALRYYRSTPADKINIINTIGLTYRNDGHLSIAMKYFKDALTLAKASNDSTWMAIAAGNIGSIYFRERDYEKALPLVEADYRQSLKFHQKLNALIALLRLVRINIDENKLNMATGQLQTAHSLLLASKQDALIHWVKYYELNALLNDRMGNSSQAIAHRIKFERLRDSAARRDNATAIERVKLQWEMERSQAEIKRIRTIAENDAYKLNTIILVLVLLFIISVLIYNHQRLKGLRDRELMAVEKRRVDQDLKNATLALQGYTENLMHKNLLIDQFKTEIEKLQEKYSTADGAELMDKMTHAHIMTESNWNDFKKLFNRVHSAFFYNLRNRFPHLSATDTRLLALIKLRLNNREMAGMLGITIDGVKKSKQRLRKKMEIKPEAEIETVIAEL